MRCAVIALALLSSCERPPVPAAPEADVAAPSGSRSVWDLQSSDEGTALVIASRTGAVTLRLFCPAGEGKLLVNSPSFRAIGSEERLSVGQGGEVVALVADPSGDKQRGGVTGEGATPKNLMQLLSGEVSASYGAQVSGPHPPPPPELVHAFVAACAGGRSSEGTDTETPAASHAGSSPCMMQDGKTVPANSIRAVGTEPFWGGRVEGRCVTYSHPDDQAGTRVWTKFAGTTANGSWIGSLNGRPFVMRTRPEAGCSDGMSDRRYPIAVSLSVGGEERSGCAEPL